MKHEQYLLKNNMYVWRVKYVAGKVQYISNIVAFSEGDIQQTLEEIFGPNKVRVIDYQKVDHINLLSSPVCQQVFLKYNERLSADERRYKYEQREEITKTGSIRGSNMEDVTNE